jgi:hypothetical protein
MGERNVTQQWPVRKRWVPASSARGFAVAGTASHFEWRVAGHTKTNPATMQLTTLNVDH